MLISTYLALLGSYGLQSAQNSLIALKITPLGPPQFQNGVLLDNRPSIGQIILGYPQTSENSLLPPYGTLKGPK